MLKRLLLIPFLMGIHHAHGQDGSSGVLAGIQSAGSPGSNGVGSIFSPNLYDGTATVNIPIFDYKVNGQNLGVSIGYSTHGIRVNQIPSSVGIGWDLAAGGKITRRVQGIEDEVTIYAKRSFNILGEIPWYNGVWFGDRNLGNALSVTKEKEFDQFTASFAGRSINFTIEVLKDGTSVVKTDPIKNVKIKAFVQKSEASNPAGGNSGFASSLLLKMGHSPDVNQLAFEITDEIGNVFVFGWGEYEEKKPNDTCVYYAPHSWNLTDVHTANGQHVKYTYGQRDVDYVASHFQQTLDVYDRIYWPSDGTYTNTGVYKHEEKYISKKGKETYLEKIDYPNGTTVSFDYRTDQLPGYHTYPLHKISITGSDKFGTVNKKTFEFKHTMLISSFYNMNPAVEIQYISGNALFNVLTINQGLSNSFAQAAYDRGTRLNLKEINIIGNDGSSKEKYYSFLYNTTPLPIRFDDGQDYYGYYNGRKKDQSIPAHLRPFNVISHTYAPTNRTYGMDKTPDINYAQARILSQITNGAGGYIDIRYKDHDLYNPKHGYTGCDYVGSNVPSTVFPVYEMENANDGVCIDEIIVSDGYSKDNRTRTKYEFSGGQRFFRGGFSWVEYGSSHYACHQTLEGKLYSNSFITPMQFINGCNHGYSNAKVKTFNAQQTLLGTTEYHFTNLLFDGDSTRSNLSMDNNTRYNHYPINYFYSYRMGKVLSISSYDHAGTLTKKEEFNYSDYFARHYQAQIPFKSHRSIVKVGPCETEYWSFIAFPFLTQKHKTTEYLSGTPFVKNVEYVYNGNYDLVSTRWTDDDNNLNISEFTYTRGNGSLPPRLRDLTLNTSTSLKRVIGGTSYLIDRKETEFESANIDIKSQSRLYNGSPYAGSNPAAHIDKVEEYTKRDDKGNVLETRIAGKVYNATLWDNRIGCKTATVSNATFEEIAHTSFEGDFEPLGTPDFNKGNWNFHPSNVIQVQPGQPDQPITGRYYYSLSGSDEVSTAFPPVNGNSYILSAWATVMPRVMIGNQYVLFTEHMRVGDWRFYTAEFTGNGAPLKVSRHPGSLNPIKLDELRLYPSRATISTMTHEPLLGLSSSTDERGNTVYYEYDPMGRLKVTRDLNHNVLTVNRNVVAGSDNY